MKKRGFTLLELIVVMAIIGVLSSVIVIATTNARIKSRDTKRKAEVAQFGRILTAPCHVPGAGPGEYDIVDVIGELSSIDNEIAEFVAQVPIDPSGSTTESRYRYIVTGDQKCIFYANLENQEEPVTLSDISVPTPGRGVGVFDAGTPGWNGSSKFFQVSN